MVPLLPFPDGVLEVQAINIYLRDGEVVTIMNGYNPNENLSYNEILHYLNQLGNSYILTGDFNAHSPILDDNVINADVSGRAVENLLLQNDACLINPLNFYTRIEYTINGPVKSCLDLIITSNNLAHKTTVDNCPGYETSSDHLPIKINVELAPAIEKRTFRKKWKTNPENLVNFKSS